MVEAALLEPSWMRLPELVAETLEEYEALAFRLATEPDFLAGIKARLSANRLTYPLFDTDRTRRNIETAYSQMFERALRGEPPTPFSVSEAWTGE